MNPQEMNKLKVLLVIEIFKNPDITNEQLARKLWMHWESLKEFYPIADYIREFTLSNYEELQQKNFIK